MKKISVIIISLIFFTNVFAQNPNDAIVMFSSGTVRIKDFKPVKKSDIIKGSYYYNDNWYKGSLLLIDNKILKGYPLKYDLRHNSILIKTDDGLRETSIGTVKEIQWENNKNTIEVLKNCFLFNNSKDIGFYQFLNNGKISLLKKTNLKLLNSNYNQVMVSGEDYYKFVKEDKYYIYTNDKIYSVKKNKRKILKFFKDKAVKVKEFASENNLSFKNDYDLTKIFNYYNNL